VYSAEGEIVGGASPMPLHRVKLSL